MQRGIETAYDSPTSFRGGLMFDYLSNFFEDDPGQLLVIPLEELPVGLITDEL